MDQSREDAMAQLYQRLSLLERKVQFLFDKLSVRYKEEIPPYLEESAALLRQGRKAEAIEAYTNRTGAGLAAAKAAIAELEALLRDD